MKTFARQCRSLNTTQSNTKFIYCSACYRLLFYTQFPKTWTACFNKLNSFQYRRKSRKSHYWCSSGLIEQMCLAGRRFHYIATVQDWKCQFRSLLQSVVNNINSRRFTCICLYWSLLRSQVFLYSFSIPSVLHILYKWNKIYAMLKTHQIFSIFSWIM